MKSSYWVKCVGAEVDLMQISDSTFIVTRVIVPVRARGFGHGTALMKMLTAAADAEMMKLMLEPQPYTNTWTVTKLRNWYSQFGFISEVQRPEVMVREPHLVISHHKGALRCMR